MPKHLFLSGPMGAGKSTVGPLVAAALGRPFVDLDASIERETGMRIAEIFRSRGEATFRRLEADVVRRLVGHEEPGVFALGGGTVEDPETRAFLLDRGVVVTLSAPLEVLLERAMRDPHHAHGRPLLAGDAPGAALARILERRRDAYAEAHRTVDTSRVPAEEVARELAESFADDAASILVRLGARSYRVVVRAGASRSLGRELARLGASRAVVVTDRNVRPFADACASGLGLPTTWVELEPGEQHKGLAAIERIWDAALDARADRDVVVVAIGGGVVGDLAGFAAATLLRGARVVQVPTTLLAMVDSSVGGKTGIDRPQGKNLVGAFHQPSVVLCDEEALATLPARELRAAMAELVKTAWIEGEADVAALERDAGLLLGAGEAAGQARARAVARAVRTKARIVALDETEQGPRRWLNLGHTLGHAVEAASGYALLHGEAVAIGLVAAARVSVALGRAQQAHQQRLEALLTSLGLPIDPPVLEPDEVARFLAADKKAQGGLIRFVTLAAPGEVGPLAIDPARVLASWKTT
jgi:shikimate kinase/3-dehydroquinate synthase